MAALTPHHDTALAAPSRDLLGELAGRAWADDFYLAGSAALALYLAHRTVHGLDLMAGTNRLASRQRRDLLADLLALDPGLRVETARDGYLYARSGAGVPLKLFYYPYPLIAPIETYPPTDAGGPGPAAPGMAVASPLDLGLMKIAAIISRGTRRDFADLYLLCRELPLAELLARSPEKFGHVRDFPLQALKGLADLDQAVVEPLPELAGGVGWNEVAAWAREEVRRLGREAVGLPLSGPG